MKITIWILGSLILILIIALIVTNLPAVNVGQLKKQMDRIDNKLSKFA